MTKSEFFTKLAQIPEVGEISQGVYMSHLDNGDVCFCPVGLLIMREAEDKLEALNFVHELMQITYAQSVGRAADRLGVPVNFLEGAISKFDELFDGRVIRTLPASEALDRFMDCAVQSGKDCWIENHEVSETQK